MGGWRWWKPVATAAMLAGSLATTVLTATAASEGLSLGSALTQAGEGQAPASTVTPQTWAWHGKVAQSDREGFTLELQTPCRAWGLLPATDAVGTSLEGLVGQAAIVVGQIASGTEGFKGPAIHVEQVATERSQVPEGTKPFPKCKGPERGHRPQPVPQPGLLGLLERLGLQGLRDIPQDQRFEHFLAAQTSILDAQGNVVTARLTAGVVTQVAAESLTLDPNGLQTVLTVPVTAETKVLRPGDGGFNAIVSGDKVLVLQVNEVTVLIVSSAQITAWPSTLGSVFGQAGMHSPAFDQPGMGQPGLLSGPLFGTPGQGAQPRARAEKPQLSPDRGEDERRLSGPRGNARVVARR